MWPHAPRRPVDHAWDAPDIGIVMHYPTRAPYMSFAVFARSETIPSPFSAAVRAFLPDWIFGWPIIHFRIDVDRIFAVPCRICASIPDTLRVSRLSAGLWTGNKQITTELVIHGNQLRIRGTMQNSGCEYLLAEVKPEKYLNQNQRDWNIFWYAETCF